MEKERKPRTNFPVDEQLVSEPSHGSNCGKEADTASGNQTEVSTNAGSQSQNSRKRKRPESPCDTGIQ